MSLTVRVFTLHGGETQLLDTPECCEDLAGFESWRTEVWGSAAARALGVRFFPMLDGGELMARPDEVPDFVVETKIMRANLDRLVPEPDRDHSREWYLDTISSRLANIQIAAGRALGVGGGVLIW
ncbi:hypothetical protein VSH64_34540 [Amycolatopsis rhabdoformis]|uniref:Uncharacterized protein n=1 Tax=Amycolatopsis rhabdoformis TaxID=1448059 RepID=A0ABZ1I2Y9_9PSEU|nr:hypothetical protein [Amycolatopsis rhabdoformis]WSE27938.1 hypothetical protein VSH64_34540 [Amycolatopsis rhabdoformis]